MNGECAQLHHRIRESECNAIDHNRLFAKSTPEFAGTGPAINQPDLLSIYISPSSLFSTAKHPLINMDGQHG